MVLKFLEEYNYVVWHITVNVAVWPLACICCLSCSE